MSDERQGLADAIERLTAHLDYAHGVPPVSSLAQAATDLGLVLKAGRDYLEALRIADEIRAEAEGPIVVATRTADTPDEYRVMVMPDDRFDRRPPEVMLGADPATPDTIVTAMVTFRDLSEAHMQDEFPGRGDGE